MARRHGGKGALVGEMMNAVVVREPGGPDVLEYVRVPRPAVCEGRTLVRVYGFGINHSEVFTRQGLSPSVKFPRILGIECVGRVAETSDPVRLPVGARVASLMGEMGRDFDGGYAEFCLLPNEQVHPIETDLDWERMAAVPETYYTAYLSMRNLRLADGQRILVRGGTSGVGVAFARLVRAGFPGAIVVGTTRSIDKLDRVRAAGFDDAVVDADGALQVDRAEGGFDRVLELIGPATMKDTCAHVREGGIVCSTGQLGGQWALDGFDPIVDLPPNGYLTSAYSDNVDGEVLQELFDFIARHDIDVAPERAYRLSEAADAHAHLEGSCSFGKLVVLNDVAR